ncbi:hypothetical protein [Qaidamihabitans albus]|uniref:hypothetical protein n=1 Tax=Qaidamihabitans albus TaxID=2795733 RepID=UPI0018F22E3C|nr:hypothetical protein [Qaidamihabitans albus]
MGTLVTKGSGSLAVTAIGAHPAGEIQRLVAAELEPTPLTRKLARFARLLTVAIRRPPC